MDASEGALEKPVAVGTVVGVVDVDADYVLAAHYLHFASFADNPEAVSEVDMFSNPFYFSFKLN